MFREPSIGVRALGGNPRIVPAGGHFAASGVWRQRLDKVASAQGIFSGNFAFAFKIFHGRREWEVRVEHKRR